LEIISFDNIDSTQKYLIEAINKNRLSAPIAVIAKEQYLGVGSRGNSWEGGVGNLYTSIALKKEDLPDDLPTASASIYFGWLMRDILSEYDDRVWLKWPNDIYIESNKIGGIITYLKNSIIIVGIGINMNRGSNSYYSIELDLTPYELLNIYIKKLQQKISWKSIFSKYRLEFEKSREFFSHYKEKKFSLKGVTLCSDGSLIKNGERIVSIR